MTYSFEDKDGAVTLFKRGQIVMVVLSGACGTSVINFYAKKLKVLAQSFKGQPWAYLCNGKDFQAATPEAQKTIIGAYASSMELGCCYQAYCYDSHVGIAQTQQIMRDCGSKTDIKEVLFANEQLAETFLLNKLAAMAEPAHTPPSATHNKVN